MTEFAASRLLFGYHMPNLTFPDAPPDELFDRIAANVLAAEAAGFDLVTVMDHFQQIAGVGAEDEPMLEAYATLGALAARTSRVRLGTMVTGVTHRNPALLAKAVTTLDVISRGRAILGIGAAWNEAEHQALGIDFPPIKERMTRRALRRLRSEIPCLRMDFDHRDPATKVQSVSRMIGRAGAARILAEASKCDIVCANCHRSRTHSVRAGHLTRE